MKHIPIFLLDPIFKKKQKAIRNNSISIVSTLVVLLKIDFILYFCCMYTLPLYEHLQKTGLVYLEINEVIIDTLLSMGTSLITERIINLKYKHTYQI